MHHRLVVTEMSVAALVVVMGMVHAPTIAAIAVVFRSQRFTGGQLSFVSFALTSGETIVWNAAFSAAVIGIVAFLLARNKDLMGR